MASSSFAPAPKPLPALLLLLCGAAAASSAAPVAPPVPTPAPPDAYSFAAVSTDGRGLPNPPASTVDASPSWRLPDLDGLLLVLAAFGGAIFVASRRRD